MMPNIFYRRTTIQLLRQLRDGKLRSAMQLAKESGLSLPTTLRLIDELHRMGIIELVSQERPIVPILNQEHKLYPVLKQFLDVCDENIISVWKPLTCEIIIALMEHRYANYSFLTLIADTTYPSLRDAIRKLMKAGIVEDIGKVGTSRIVKLADNPITHAITTFLHEVQVSSGIEGTRKTALNGGKPFSPLAFLHGTPRTLDKR